MKIKILRVVSENKLISADAFEDNFKKFSTDLFHIDYVSADKINELLFNSYTNSLINELDSFSKYDYISFGFGSFLSVPIFLKLRNKYNLDTRLLFISHAPGKHILEFYFMEKFLKKGDLIIAPTNSAAETIKYISPALFQYTKTIYHPIEIGNMAEDKKYSNNKNFFLVLSRIHPEKLIHRIIEAVNIVKKKDKNLMLIIAGNLLDEKGNETYYSKLLKNMVKELKLENHVKFIGEIRDIKKKIYYIRNAKALINLSVTVEESFGKSIVESIQLFTPVIVSKWDGFMETADNCGIFVPVHLKNGFADILPSDIATAIELISKKENIFKKNCFSHKNKFKISNIEGKYYNILSKIKLDNCENIFLENKNRRGILEELPVIRAFSYKELFEIYLDYIRESLIKKSNKITHGAILHEIITLSLSKYLRYFYSRKEFKDHFFAIDTKCDNIIDNNFYYKLISSIYYASSQYSKELILFFCLKHIDIEYFSSVLNKIEPFFKNKRNIYYLKIEVAILKGNYKHAKELWHNFFSERDFQENDYILIRQISKIYRKLGKPNKSIELIKNWLVKYKFSQYSLPIWTDLCYNAIESGADYLQEAENAFNKVATLSDDLNLVNKLHAKLLLLKLSGAYNEK